jgi:hypothetical protein
MKPQRINDPSELETLWLLFFRHGVAGADQFVEFALLLGNALGRSFFILRARRRRRLFDQLPDIAPQDRDAVVEFRWRKRIVVAHVRSLDVTGFAARTRWNLFRSG